MSGAYHFNEVFLDDVFVPETDLVGRLGEGWTVLRTMLASERAAIGGGTSARSAVQLVGPRRPAGARRRAGGASMVGGRLHAGASAGPRQDADDRPRRRARGRSAQQVALLGARRDSRPTPRPRSSVPPPRSPTMPSPNPGSSGSSSRPGSESVVAPTRSSATSSRSVGWDSRESAHRPPNRPRPTSALCRRDPR